MIRVRDVAAPHRLCIFDFISRIIFDYRARFEFRWCVYVYDIRLHTIQCSWKIEMYVVCVCVWTVWTVWMKHILWFSLRALNRSSGSSYSTIQQWQHEVSIAKAKSQLIAHRAKGQRTVKRKSKREPVCVCVCVNGSLLWVRYTRRNDFLSESFNILLEMRARIRIRFFPPLLSMDLNRSAIVLHWNKIDWPRRVSVSSTETDTRHECPPTYNKHIEWMRITLLVTHRTE